MQAVVEQTFWANLKILRINGLYQSAHFKLWYIIFGYIMYFIFVYPVPILGILNFFYLEEFDLLAIADNAFLLSEWASLSTKLVVFIHNGSAARKCILYLQNRPIFIKKLRNERQQQIMDNCVRVCSRTSKFFLYSVTITVTGWFLRPLFLQGQRLPVDLWFPFDITANFNIYCILYASVILSTMYAAFTNGVLDPLASGLMYLACGQFKILKDNLIHLKQYAQEDLENAVGLGKSLDDVIYDKIKECIDYHNEILSFCKLYENIFSMVAFSQAVASTIAICISCLEITLVEPFTWPFFTVCMFGLTMTFEIYLYCHFGAMLFYESDTVAKSIYMGNWYEFDIKCQKALLLLMERSKKPVVITAGKLFQLNLESFGLLIKRSYSLLAVLKNY